jgi:hypothetical protein
MYCRLYMLGKCLWKEAIKLLFSLTAAMRNLPMTNEIHRSQGDRKEPVLKPINEMVATYLEEDRQTDSHKATFALLISDQMEAPPEKIVQVYRKRIEWQ